MFPYRLGDQDAALSRLKPQFESGWGHRVKRDERENPAHCDLKSSTLFGSLAVMTSIAGFRPITLRRQFSLVLPVRWSGDHDQQS